MEQYSRGHKRKHSKSFRPFGTAHRIINVLSIKFLALTVPNHRSSLPKFSPNSWGRFGLEHTWSSTQEVIRGRTRNAIDPQGCVGSTPTYSAKGRHTVLLFCMPPLFWVVTENIVLRDFGLAVQLQALDHSLRRQKFRTVIQMRIYVGGG